MRVSCICWGLGGPGKDVVDECISISVPLLACMRNIPIRIHIHATSTGTNTALPAAMITDSEILVDLVYELGANANLDQRGRISRQLAACALRSGPGGLAGSLRRYVASAPGPVPSRPETT